ncbi:hypothetical protein L6303_00005 [archaeon]|nr:hypothetical protein [Nanoarchaeota archaeon]MBU4451592.1 hypothetical protein [Nanoarchaeota archaeon]MCG2723114.1 hypothetical protein [archaeon]
MTKTNKGVLHGALLIYALIAAIFLAAYGNDAYALLDMNISAENSIIMLGEIERILINCTDNSSNITAVYADINTTKGFFPNNVFENISNITYMLSISTKTNSPFYIAGHFNVAGYCKNSLNETANANISFIVVNHTLQKERPINISIDSFDNGYISYFDYQKELTQYSRMNITVEFTNSGSTSYSKKTELDIYGFSEGKLVLIANRSGAISSLTPGSRSVEKLRYTPMQPGWFWIRIQVHYSNKTANAWGVFQVKPYYNIIYYPPPTPPSSGGGSYEEIIRTVQLENPPKEVSIPKKIVDVGKKNIALSYPDKIYITPGDSAVAYVIVTNKGTMALREIQVLGQINGDIIIDVQPRIVSELYGNNSAVFMITLDTNTDTNEGIYSLDFTAYTDKMKDEGHIDVEVGKATLDDSLERTILNYQYLIIKLEDEMDELNIAKKNTSKVVPYINEAKNTLSLAKSALKLKDYEKTRDNLKKTRNSLINAVIEMARARGDTMLIVMAPTIWLLIILLIIMLITAVMLYMHKRDKEKAKEGLTKEDKIDETWKT